METQEYVSVHLQQVKCQSWASRGAYFVSYSVSRNPRNTLISPPTAVPSVLTIRPAFYSACDNLSILCIFFQDCHQLPSLAGSLQSVAPGQNKRTVSFLSWDSSLVYHLDKQRSAHPAICALTSPQHTGICKHNDVPLKQDQTSPNYSQLTPYNSPSRLSYRVLIVSYGESFVGLLNCHDDFMAWTRFPIISILVRENHRLPIMCCHKRPIIQSNEDSFIWTAQINFRTNSDVSGETRRCNPNVTSP